MPLLLAVPRDSQGRSDFVEALVVALQLLSRPELTTSGKRVLLVSNLCCRVGAVVRGA
jgi:exosome complex RNA-binding protein Csl4